MVIEHAVDIVDISDLRFPGGTSHSIAEELAAQADAGYHTGLVHLNGPLITKVRAVNPLIRRQIEAGAADLLVDRRPIRATLAVFRHPAVIQHALTSLPPIEAEHVVVVANAGPDDIDGYRHYDPAVVDRALRDRLGVTPMWAPIGPLVRDAIADLVPEDSLMADDWVNIIDVDAWKVDRDGWLADRPVIGRHSRSSPQKWPADAATIRAVYPMDGSMIVRVLGGAQPAETIVGPLPESWQVLPFGAQSPREFLAGLDFFVYYHDPRWVEAFGRTILEALASGVVAVLPPHFRALFGDAACYAEPTQVRSTIERLRADRAAYDHQVDRAEKITRATFGREAHVSRIAALIGPPAAVAEKPRVDSPVDDDVPVLGEISAAPLNPVKVADRRDRPTVLFVSSNGAGMGHLTRLLSYARRGDAEIAPHVLSLSQAVPVVSGFGYPYEYLPSSKATGMSSRAWQTLFVERMVQTIRRVQPTAVVFDGTWPYEGIPAIRAQCPGVAWVWSRRGMWRAGMNRDQLAKAAWFDSVIEPGDFAAAYDAGVTKATRAVHVGPVTLLDTDELDDRATARATLGLPADGPLALVTLGAGNINDTSGPTGAVAAALSDLGVGVCVTRPPISTGHHDIADIHVVRGFPLSRQYTAFDLAISAAGYNSYHELLRFGVPSLFIPNTATALDDQEARSRFAADHGLALELRDVTPENVRPLLERLLTDGFGMVSGVAEVDPGNGAHQAAAHIALLTRIVAPAS